MIFFHIFWIISMNSWIKSFIFNMLKPLFTSCILHLLKYIETHAIQCFIIIEWKFFHIFRTINNFKWIESCTLNLLKPLFKYFLLHLLVYIKTQITI
jgi:hypothetical protein